MIFNGIKQYPHWVNNRMYGLGTTSSVAENFAAFLYILLDFMRDKIQIPHNSVGLVMGFGSDDFELLTIAEKLNLSIVHGIDFNGARVEHVAKDLFRQGLSPHKFILHHADMNNLRDEISDNSIGLVYASAIAVNPREDREELKESFAEEVVRILKPGGIAFINSQGINLRKIFLQHGRLFGERAPFILFQKASSPQISSVEKTDAGDDQAMRSEKGGIDLKPDKMNMQVHNGDGEIKFHIDRAMLERFQNAPGFEPVIVDVKFLPPGRAGVRDLKLFLGIKDQTYGI